MIQQTKSTYNPFKSAIDRSASVNASNSASVNASNIANVNASNSASVNASRNKNYSYSGMFKDPRPPSPPRLVDMDFPDISSMNKTTIKNTTTMDFAMATAVKETMDEEEKFAFVLEPGTIRLYKNENNMLSVEGPLPIKKPTCSPEYQWEQGLNKMIQCWDNYKEQCIEQQGEDIEKRWFYIPTSSSEEEEEDYNDSYSEHSYEDGY